MTLFYLIGGIAASALLMYLLVALFCAEDL
jgi:hypothetical protein